MRNVAAGEAPARSRSETQLPANLTNGPSVSEIGSERPIHNVKRDDRRHKSRVETLDQLDCGDVATAEFVADKGEADNRWGTTHKQLSL